MSKAHPTLRRRLLTVLLLMIILVWCGISYLVYRSANVEVEEIYDATLSLNNRFVVGLLNHEILHEMDESETLSTHEIAIPGHADHPYEFKIAIRAYYPNGKLAINTVGAPEFPMPTHHGFSTEFHNGNLWRIYRFLDKDTDVGVVTAQQMDVRKDLVDYMLSHSLAALGLGIPFFGLVIWWGIGSGLKPLITLSSELENRDSGSLQPIDDAKAPAEVHSLVLAINHLFRRMIDSLHKERRFTSDAAHELHTPLSGIKLQTQVAMRASNDKQRARALEHILSGVDDATHLINQLLTLARLDASSVETWGEVDLLALLRHELASAVPMANSKGIVIALKAPKALGHVSGSKTLIGIMLRNLIDNALRYSPPDSQLHLKAVQQNDSIEITIRDQGPGIDEESIPALFERFKRGGTERESGSGLGLSIVKQICELNAVELTMHKATNDSGLVVNLLFKTIASHNKGE